MQVVVANTHLKPNTEECGDFLEKKKFKEEKEPLK